MSTYIHTGGSAFPLATDGGHFSEGMTLRQYAAIKLKVPDSGTDWLDEMITKSLRNDFAAKAMQGLMGRSWAAASGKFPENLHDVWATAAYAMADAMLKAREA
jgi:hypothetical protein